MTEGFPFVGRQIEMSKIEKTLFDWGTAQFLFVYSENGGIGKTRILQEIRNKYSDVDYDERRLLIVPIIDFDDRSVNSRGTLQRKMVSELGDEKFTSYLRKMIDWRKLEAVGVSPQRLEEESYRVTQEFQNCLNQIALSHRVVFLLDTTDKVESSEIWDFLRSIASESQNIIIVVSGRNAEIIYHQYFQAITGRFRQVLIPLLPLTSDESDQYLQIKLSHIKQVFDQGTVEKIKLLSKGIPILFDLALERLAQDDRFAEFLASKPSHYFENLSIENRIESEKILVSYLANQRSELAELVLLLAHVYPVNRSMLLSLLHLDSLTEVEKLLKKALATVYIKQLPGERISLHDEMRRMVNEHVWPICDPENNQRKQYSEKATVFFAKDIQFLSSRIEKLYKEPPSLEISIQIENLTRRKDSAQIEYLRHLLVIDLNQSIDYYLKTVDDARQEHRLRFAQKMGAYVKGIESRLNRQQKYQIEMARLKQMIDSGPQLAPQVKQTLLVFKKNPDLSDHQMEVLNLLGKCEALMGNYEQALVYEEEVLGSLSRLDDIVNVSTYIGYVYRLQGDWRSATTYYKKALDQAQTSSKISANTVANIYNNLAYVVCLMGNYVEAKEYCLEAIRIWEVQGLTSSLGRGYLTRAIIYRDRGKYTEANTFFKKAIGIFQKVEEPDDNKYLASAYFEYAWSLWFEGDIYAYENDAVEAQNLYLKSKDYFDQAREMADSYELISLLPGITNQMSNVYRRLGLKEDARRLIREAYALSKKYNDIRHQVDSLLGFAEFDVDDGNYERIDGYAKELKENFEDRGYEFPLFYGRMKRIQAEAALSIKNWEISKQLYATSIAQISQHGGYGLYFLDRELARLKTLLQKSLSPENIIEWLIYFKAYWIKNANQQDEKLGKMVGWCNTFISQTKFGGYKENE
jgi:tetratricopeptide (TPR) repeat protein